MRVIQPASQILVELRKQFSKLFKVECCLLKCGAVWLI
jgi:hypothetical protein